jgi:flavin reductase (DIM6/NTAB) family NADH-FMN oxidoreductase RutF
VSIATISVPTPHPHYHGATLSSLTSISLAPLPLLAFSLRLPSRLASAINSSLQPPSASSSSSPPLPTIILHYLSSSQTPLAASFAKALPAPPPSSSESSTPSDNPIPIPPTSPFFTHPFHLSPEGIPVLQGCVGAVSCRILGSIPLSQSGLSSVGFSLGSLPFSPDFSPSLSKDDGKGKGEDVTSELYIAEVVRMEDCSFHGDVGEVKKEEQSVGLPLVYHDQRYCSVGSLDAGRKKTIEEEDGGIGGGGEDTK